MIVFESLIYKMSFLRLTLMTIFNLPEDPELYDVNGRKHAVRKDQVYIMLAIGWASFLLSWMMNILFYLVHPSVLDLHKERSRSRLFVHIFGKKVHLYGFKDINEIDDGKIIHS